MSTFISTVTHCVKKYGDLVHSLLPISQELHSASVYWCCFLKKGAKNKAVSLKDIKIVLWAVGCGIDAGIKLSWFDIDCVSWLCCFLFNIGFYVLGNMTEYPNKRFGLSRNEK